MSLNKRSDEFGVTIGAEYINAISDSVAESLTKPAGGTAALISVIATAAIKWRTDGIDPTQTVGHPLAPGGHLELFLDEVDKVSIICGEPAGTAEVFVTYFAERV